MPFKRSSGSSEIIPGHTLSFSGYPGVIYSGDDFSILSSGPNIYIYLEKRKIRRIPRKLFKKTYFERVITGYIYKF